MVVSMTLEELQKMAQQTAAFGVHPSGEYIYSFYTEQLQAFAALVASAEREACIVDIQMHIPRSGRHTSEYQMAMRMLERIKARGQA